MKGRADKLDLKFTTIAFRWQKIRLFHFPFFFRQLPENSGLVGNLIEHEAETTNNHVSVLSFVSERVGNIWKIEIDWLFSPCAQRFVGPTCHASFQLELMGGAS